MYQSDLMPFRVRVKKRALAYVVCSSLALFTTTVRRDRADDVCNNAKSLHSLYKLRPVTSWQWEYVITGWRRAVKHTKLYFRVVSVLCNFIGKLLCLSYDTWNYRSKSVAVANAEDKMERWSLAVGRPHTRILWRANVSRFEYCFKYLSRPSEGLSQILKH